MDSACVGLYTPVLEEAQYHLLATQIIFCSGYTLLLYDWILTLAREYRLIWPIRWGPVKYLYLFCRYYPIITLPFTLFSYTRNHDLSFCTSTFRIPVALATWNQLGAEAILLARTAAFWCNRRWVVGLLLASLSTVIAYQIWVIFVPMKLLPFFIPPFTKGPCLPFDEGAHIMGMISPGKLTFGTHS
ncbi:hypothetical protein FRC03_000394 [Tulasnella sp. 419]|nr:hypothetical protein FRC03_000394 [Tulasnella sp. 419]